MYGGYSYGSAPYGGIPGKSNIITKTLTENLKVNDSVLKFISKTFSNAVQLSDSIITSSKVIKVVIESIILVDSIVRKLGGVLIDIWTKSEKILTNWVKIPKK